MAAAVRWELAQTSLRMTASRPSFGVGIGSFYCAVRRIRSPELLRIFPPAIHENAHNNFLQILAELGDRGVCRRSCGCSGKAAMLCAGVCSAPILHDPLRWGTVDGSAGLRALVARRSPAADR